MDYVLGVDGGGTKTLAAIADTKGKVLGMARTGPSNFQGWGAVRAKIELEDAVAAAVKNAGVKKSQIAYATYGIAGADRDKDFDTVHSYVEPVNFAPRYMITNDTTIALRAGTDAGVGVALIGGTGSNIIGFSSNYRQWKVGGHGRFTGDHGSSSDIALKGIIASLKYWDGRGPKTALYDAFINIFGVEELIDIIEFEYIDSYLPLKIGDYAPVVFQTANQGDRVALRILKTTGKQVGSDANACIRRLFKKKDSFRVVLAGSVFQRGENPTLLNSMTETILKRFPKAEVVKLKNEPCEGALLWSIDSLRNKPTSKTVTRKLAASFSRMYKLIPKEDDQ